jgi:hypothetical protein
MGMLTGGILLLSGSQAKAANATNCITSLQNGVGDSITVTGLLTTTDPNENGEGEDVVFEGSGGELIGATGHYFMARTFTYTATQKNESITGLNVDFDNDESCSVSAVVTTQSLKFGFLTQADRDALADAAQAGQAVGTSAGVIALLCANNIISGTLCSIPATGTAVISGAAAFLLNLIAKDPSDPNFTIVATPVINTLPPVTANGIVTSAEANGFNALLTNQETYIAYGLAAVTSFNRAQGASDAGNTFWKARQFQAATTYLNQVILLLATEPGSRMNLSNLLIADSNFSTIRRPIEITTPVLHIARCSSNRRESVLDGYERDRVAASRRLS